MDPYRVLGVERNATEQEIKRAYRSLSLQYHPDRNPSEEAKTKILEVNNAYEILGDKEKRRQYDVTGSVGNEMPGGGHGGPFPGGANFQFHFGGAPGGGFFHSSGPGGMPGIFEQFFGGAGGIPGAGSPFEHIFRRFSMNQKPPALEKVIEITLDQVMTGAQKFQIPIERKITVFDPPNAIGDRNFIHEEKTEKFMLCIDIPMGIQSDESMMVGGEGHQWRPYHQTAMEPIPPVSKGDILLKIVILEHASYVRRGLDLVYKKKIPLRESLCGTRFMLPSIGNREAVNCHCDIVITPGMNKVCPGLGLRRDGAVGNLVIEFEVEFPEKITEEQRAWLSANLL
jgi:molecular chaperone DnaJ/curved DNA-binding protein